MSKTGKQVNAKAITKGITDTLPGILMRFAGNGHRSVRVSLVVESMDPFPDNQPATEIPLAMVPLVTLDPRKP